VFYGITKPAQTGTGAAPIQQAAPNEEAQQPAAHARSRAVVKGITAFIRAFEWDSCWSTLIGL